MTDFGGLGGVRGGRAANQLDAFEQAVARCMGEQLRACEPGTAHFEGKNLAQRLWGTLANACFKHKNGDTASYSFRAAGDLIAAVRGKGDYMDWYCSADYDMRDEAVLSLLRTEGWEYD